MKFWLNWVQEKVEEFETVNTEISTFTVYIFILTIMPHYHEYVSQNVENVSKYFKSFLKNSAPGIGLKINDASYLMKTLI